MTSHPARPHLHRIDVFCRVIDNHGDLGVCWRLAADLAARGHGVRLWVDDAQALSWMAPGALRGSLAVGSGGVEVRDWAEAACAAALASLAPAALWIEGFGCELPAAFVADRVARVEAGAAHRPVWLNLEYLSAEAYVSRSHGLPSTVLHGPAVGWTKWFYYPGFTADTGGLLREPGLMAARQAFCAAEWLNRHPWSRPRQGDGWRFSLFCYEPAPLADWLDALAARQPPVTLLVAPGRPTAAVRHALRLSRPAPAIVSYPALPQTEFDALLWACDFNSVRGEDSLVRALWAGQPFVWHIYPQDDDAHHAKLLAFLDWLDAPASLRAFHLIWNGVQTGTLPTLHRTRLAAWRECVQAARARLLAHDDLCSQLLRFAAGRPCAARPTGSAVE